MLWKKLMDLAQYVTLLHPSFVSLNVAGRNFEIYTSKFHTNLYTVWKDPVRVYIQLQLITCNSGQFEAIFLLGLPVSAIKLGIDYRPCLRHPLRGDSQAGEGGNRSSASDKSPKPEKKRGHNWTVSVYIVFKYFLTVPGI